jgi:hypothetical protein
MRGAFECYSALAEDFGERLLARCLVATAECAKLARNEPVLDGRENRLDHRWFEKTSTMPRTNDTSPRRAVGRIWLVMAITIRSCLAKL